MVNYIKKDVTTVTYGMVAHGCNCQGVMGSGVALAIRKKWPDAYERYKRVCESYNKDKELLGAAFFVTVEKEPGVDSMARVVIANLFTQHSFGNDGAVYADLDAVNKALEQAFITADAMELPLYMPRIGCGLGGLDWDTQVGPIVEELSNQYPKVDTYVCDL